MNKGLSDTLKAAFSNTNPVLRPIVQFSGIPDPHWLAGFTEGEGCFHVSIRIRKSKLSKAGIEVALHFTIGQHSRDLPLLNSFIDYLGCGGLCKSENPNISPVATYSNAELQKKVILDDNRGKPGVYKWTNTLTGACYIGSALDLSRRFRRCKTARARPAAWRRPDWIILI